MSMNPAQNSAHQAATDSETNLLESELREQHRQLCEGFPFVKIVRNCALGKEIVKLSPAVQAHYRSAFEHGDRRGLVHFVPASGAASRMFKDLVSALDSGDYRAVETLFDELDDFAFAPLVQAKLGLASGEQIPVNRYADVLRFVLYEEGLGYALIPKGSIHFHRYTDGSMRTAFEEHFHESVRYSHKGEEIRLHFTVPAEQEESLRTFLAGKADELGSRYGVTFRVEQSIQNPETDTPACYDDSLEWVYLSSNDRLRRPAGHGALIDNLNKLDADLVFVKNIDNVVPDSRKDIIVDWRKVLGGVLIEVRAGAFSILREADTKGLDRAKATEFSRKWLHIDVDTWTDRAIIDHINRPWRVCGMVKNEGEPGGGPFAVFEKDGSWSLQIVEKAQVDLDDPNQKALLEAATHFNPVDLVLGIRDYIGKAFDLRKYRNPDTGMRVFKTHEGRPIRALELPGLWNGSMHYWNTIFVEVPIETFNPVKTVFDLLREAHQ